jgi:hypothetical protein
MTAPYQKALTGLQEIRDRVKSITWNNKSYGEGVLHGLDSAIRCIENIQVIEIQGFEKWANERGLTNDNKVNSGNKKRR